LGKEVDITFAAGAIIQTPISAPPTLVDGVPFDAKSSRTFPTLLFWCVLVGNLLILSPLLSLKQRSKPVMRTRRGLTACVSAYSTSSGVVHFYRM
jgi:hypothetical protein